MSSSKEISSNLLQKLARSLFQDPSQQQDFLAALLSGKLETSSIIWLSEPPVEKPFNTYDRAAWFPNFVDHIPQEAKVGAHEMHKSGAYYALDLSSVFAVIPLLECNLENPVVLDMCASPGGKSVFAFRSLKPSLLVANEVVGKRLGALFSNFERCKVSNAAIVSCDPKHIANVAKRTAELVLVDAPCSGQSLVARGMKSPGAFHPATIKMNAMRQRRILANAFEVVSPNGYCLYTTCTYSRDENEDVIKWALKKFTDFEPIEVKTLADFRSEYSDFPSYRMWPHLGPGAGSFSALLKRKGQGDRSEFPLESFKIHWNSL